MSESTSKNREGYWYNENYVFRRFFDNGLINDPAILDGDGSREENTMGVDEVETLMVRFLHQ
jgi:hypothetical protein